MKKIIKNSIVSVLILASFYACRPEPLPNISTPTNSSVTPPSSLTITENNDSIFVADSAYWCYSYNTCATLYAFAEGNRRIEIFLGVCDSLPVQSDTLIVDAVGGSPIYYVGTKLYSINYAQKIFVQAGSGNIVSGNFNHQMQGFYVQQGNPNVYTSTAGISLNVDFQNVPFRP